MKINKYEEFIDQCRNHLKETVEVACPEMKVTVTVKEEEGEGYGVVLKGRVDDYASFEQEYQIETFEEFTRKLPIFVIYVYRNYYFATKCGGFCQNAEICKFRPEA